MRQPNAEMQGETNIDMESEDLIPVNQEIQIYLPATDEFAASNEAEFSSNRVNYQECSTSGYAQINFSSKSKPTTSMSLKYFQESDESEDDCLSDAATYCIENNVPRRDTSTNRVEVCAVIHSNRPSQSDNDSFNGMSSTRLQLFFFFINTIFVSSHMYPENPEGTRVIVGSMNMGYDIYPTLPGIELTTCSIPSACRFH